MSEDINLTDKRRTSTLLRELILDNPAEHVTLGEVLTHLGDRAFGFMIFLLAFPNCLPVPPGFSTITGALILPMALQFLMGEARPRLPRFVREKKISRAVLVKAVKVIMQPLIWFERLFQPRWLFFTQGWGEKLVGVLMILLTTVMLVPLPPPLHFLPGASLALLALGTMERDGAIITAGILVSMGAFGSLVLLAKLVTKFALGFIHHFIKS